MSNIEIHERDDGTWVGVNENGTAVTAESEELVRDKLWELRDAWSGAPDVSTAEIEVTIDPEDSGAWDG